MIVKDSPVTAREGRVRQREIAAQAGVSTSTVSRVLNNVAGISADLQRRVLAAATELGYQTLDSDAPGGRAGGRSALRHVGLFVSAIAIRKVIAPVYAAILHGAEEECRRQGMHLSYAVVEQGPEGATALAETVARNHIDGMALLAFEDHRQVEQILARDLPTVVVNTDHSTLPVDCVLGNDRAGVTLAMRHLLAHEHRRILHVTHLPRMNIRRRHDVYRAILEEAGLGYDPALVLDTGGPLSAQPAYAAMKRALAGRAPEFTAVLCANDNSANGALRALQEAGYHIPRDVSLVGYDDEPFAAFLSPPLTTIRIEREEIGVLAVRRLLERAARPALTPVRIELAARLIERQSVARARPGRG